MLRIIVNAAKSPGLFQKKKHVENSSYRETKSNGHITHAISTQLRTWL